MKLVASLIVRNEAGRYLEACLAHLAEFCDEIAVLDDCSNDGTAEYLTGQVRVPGSPLRTFLNKAEPWFDRNEGAARQKLLEWTLDADPTHILAVDADEFVEDGPALRRAIQRDPHSKAWGLPLLEVWEAAGDCLCVRTDGGWAPNPNALLWRVPPGNPAALRIANRKLACGRVPTLIRTVRTTPIDLAVLHFGWANTAARQARYDRYQQIDGGRFHARAHLESILAPSPALRGVTWPEALAPHRAAIERAALASAVS